MKKREIIPGYRTYEYQLVLNPHEDLRNRILKARSEYNEKYGAASSAFARPYIILCRFVQYELIEERLINRLNTIAMGYHPVKIEMKDFGSFPTHTIYLNITSKIPVQDLVKQIRTEAQRLMKLNDDNKPHFILEPHITIAGKLKPDQYEKSWLEYSTKHFTGRFIADSMLLLKRTAGELTYQVVKRFEFQNLLIGTKQGDLF